MNWTMTIARQDEKHLSFGMCCATRGFTIYIDKTTRIKTLWIFHNTYCTSAIHNLLSYQLCKFSILPGRPLFSRNNKSDKDILLPDLLSRLNKCSSWNYDIEWYRLISIIFLSTCQVWNQFENPCYQTSHITWNIISNQKHSESANFRRA